MRRYPRFFARLNQEYLAETVEEVREPAPEKVLIDMATGKMALDEGFFGADYYLVQFEIDDFSQHMIRFGSDLVGGLTEPF